MTRAFAGQKYREALKALRAKLDYTSEKDAA
jgi:hypothetical protein